MPFWKSRRSTGFVTWVSCTPVIQVVAAVSSTAILICASLTVLGMVNCALCCAQLVPTGEKASPGHWLPDGSEAEQTSMWALCATLLLAQ